MKPFQFQQFTVQQDEKVFRVGTDAVLLGSLSSVDHKTNILEVGSGSGIISLMLAQRNSEAKILALDLDENAFNLTKLNFEDAQFHSRLKVLHRDFKHFKTDEKFDFIISNPPYFEENDSEKDKIARQTVELSFENLIEKSKSLLTQNGILSVIIPSDSANLFDKTAVKNQLFLNRRVNIYGQQSGVLKRTIVEVSVKKSKPKIEEFTIEKSPRKYSDQYLEATKDFHVFSKNVD